MSYPEMSEFFNRLLKQNNIGYFKVIKSSSLLIGLLFVIVPFLAIMTDISPLPLVLISGFVYSGWAVSRDALLESVIGAFPVLITYNANFPVLPGVPGVTQFSIYISDAVTLALLFILFYAWKVSSSISRNRVVLIAFGSLILFVIWSFLSAVVANGPSMLAAALFGVSQLRLLSVFLVATMITVRFGVLNILGPLLLGVVGHLGFAILQILNKEQFGLYHLGEVEGIYLNVITVFGLEFPTGLYAGGFTGQSRMLVAICLLLFPIFLVTLYLELENEGVKLAAIVSSLIIVMTRISDTDAGWVSMALVLVLSSTMFGWLWIRRTTPVLKYSLLSLGSAVLLFISYSYIESRSYYTPTSSDTATGAGTGTSTSTMDSIFGIVNSITGEVLEINLDSLPVRLEQYQAAIRMASDYPLFGIGGRNFTLKAQQYGVREGVNGIHNTYLAYAAEIGIPGASLFLVSLFAIFYLTIRTAIYADGGKKALFAGIAIGMIGFHAYAFWGLLYKSPIPYAVFWTLSGVVAGENLSEYE